MSEPADTCLQCGETREVVKAHQYSCAIMSGGETIEVDYEFPRHRWADWTDKELARRGIKPEHFEEYRRADRWTLQYVNCEHLGREHVKHDDDMLPGYICPACWCDTRPGVAH